MSLARYDVRQERRAFRGVRELETADGVLGAKRQIDIAKAERARKNVLRAARAK